MSASLQLRHEPGRHVDISTSGGRLLWRYVYAPDTPANESPRPYAHPVQMPTGEVLTNFRPNDHPWHHALSLTLTSVGGVNFWGGPSHRAGEGYRWRDDQGLQVHRTWSVLEPVRLEEIVEWRERATGATLLEETRILRTALVSGGGWSLRWTSMLRNVTGRALALDNYHSAGGLAGSHYTGLQFRGARELLDEHGDTQLGISGEGGRSGEAALHGTQASWMEWSCQHDGTLRRTRIRFENLTGPLPWFVRAKNPVAAFAFHREHSHSLASGTTLQLDHALTFTPA